MCLEVRATCVRGDPKSTFNLTLMTRQIIIFALALAMVAGCKFNGNDPARFSFNDTQLDSDLNPLLSTTPHLAPSEPAIGSITSFESFDQGPLEDFNFSKPGNYRRMSLDECIAAALQNSPVIRDLGGVILRSPDSTVTDNDPALTYADPRFGEQAALSAFDAVYRGQLLFQKNDGLFNNQFIGDEGAFQQDLAEYRSGVSKLAATGARYEFNHVVNYELNNSPSNRFNGTGSTSFAYDTFLEAEVRQPLFQGAGTTFNRIAGPNNAIGVYNGILIARVNTDIALADFEARVRDLISDVENTYWDLYFAYRDLEAKIEARNGAYDIWRNVEANKGEKSAAIIGQAKEQYYRFAADVEDAIQGRLNEGTRTNNGSSSGTFRATGGVRTSERRLRLITGMVLNDSQLLVPSETPVDAASVFDWDQSRNNAFARRPELRRQRWRIKARELELLASKNHLLPRVDLLATYRARGFGRDLFGDGNQLIQDGTFEEQSDSSAFGTLLNNDLQEWELGVDVSVPIGFRVQHSAQRHAELNLSREVAVLREQERQVAFGLSNAIGELSRTNRVRAANLNRLNAANEQFEAIQNIWREQDTTIDLVLEAQRRVIEAKLQYFQSQVESMLAIKAIHFEQGTLFAYHNVALSESQAEQLAQEQHWRRTQSPQRSISYWIPGLITTHGLAATNAPATAAEHLPSPSELDNSIVPTEQSTNMLQPIFDQPFQEAVSAESNVTPVTPATEQSNSPAPLFSPNAGATTTKNATSIPQASHAELSPAQVLTGGALTNPVTQPLYAAASQNLPVPQVANLTSSSQAKPVAQPLYATSIQPVPEAKPRTTSQQVNPLAQPLYVGASQTQPAPPALIPTTLTPGNPIAQPLNSAVNQSRSILPTATQKMQSDKTPVSPIYKPNIDKGKPAASNFEPLQSRVVFANHPAATSTDSRENLSTKSEPRGIDNGVRKTNFENERTVFEEAVISVPPPN